MYYKHTHYLIVLTEYVFMYILGTDDYLLSWQLIASVFILLCVVALLDVSYIVEVHRSLLAEQYVTDFWNFSNMVYIQGCIQKFQDSTCKKKFAYLGC